MTYPNWFEMTARANFERYLLNYRAGLQNFTALQIGAYVGHATEWMTDNVLRSGDVLYDVDTWEGSDEAAHHAMDWVDVGRDYFERTAAAINDGRVVMHCESSDEFFSMYDRHALFDFVYVDGDHTEAQVYRDACNAWPLVKVGGIMAFDDYTWGEGLPMEQRPKRAIDRFLAEAEDYRVLCCNAQVWVVKT